MKTETMIMFGLIVVLMICVIPAGAHIAVNDAFTVINSPDGNSLNLLQNDIPHPDPSIIDIEYTEKPKHGWVGGLGYMSDEDVGYYPDEFYFGPDLFKYRTYDGHSYSNEATVYLNVVPYGGLGNCPSRVWLYTPADTKLSLDSPGFVKCIGTGTPRQYLRLMSEPSHGKLAEKKCTQGGFNAYDGCFDYMPDAGFEGWDSFTVRPYVDSGSYGDCPGKLIDIAIYVGPEPYPTPEFPSALLPVIMIIGLLGAMFLIRRTREN